jgi:hypothetical protein
MRIKKIGTKDFGGIIAAETPEVGKTLSDLFGQEN